MASADDDDIVREGVQYGRFFNTGATGVAASTDEMEVTVSRESKRLAGILLIVLPSVMYGGVTLLSMLIGDPSYMGNPLRQDLWRAGHAHAGVLLILSLLALRYVDETRLSDALRRVVRFSIPSAAIFMPAGFFLSVLSSEAREPNALIGLTYFGAAVLATGVLILGIGLVRATSAPAGDR